MAMHGTVGLCRNPGVKLNMHHVWWVRLDVHHVGIMSLRIEICLGCHVYH